MLFEQKRKQVLHRRLRLARTTVRRLEQRVFYDVRPDLSILQETRDIQNLSERLQETKMTVRQAKNTLNTLLNRPVDAPLQLKPQVPEITDKPPIPWAVKSAITRRTDVSRIQGAFRREKGEIRSKKLTPLDAKGVVSYGTGGSEDLTSGPTIDGRYSIPLLYWPIVNARNREERAILNTLISEMDEKLSEIQQEVADKIETMRTEQQMLKDRRNRLRRVRSELEEAKLQQDSGALSNWSYYTDRKHLYLETVLGILTEKRNLTMTYLELAESMGASAKHLPLQKMSDHTDVDFKKKTSQKPLKKGIVVKFSRLRSGEPEKSFLRKYLKRMSYRRLVVTVDEPVQKKDDSLLGNLISEIRDRKRKTIAHVSVFDQDMNVSRAAARRLNSLLDFQERSPEPFHAIAVGTGAISDVSADTFIRQTRELKKNRFLNTQPDERVFLVVPFLYLKSLDAPPLKQFLNRLPDRFDELIVRYHASDPVDIESLLHHAANATNSSSPVPVWHEIANRHVVEHQRSVHETKTDLTPRAYREALESIAVPYQSSPWFSGVILNNYHQMKHALLPE